MSNMSSSDTGTPSGMDLNADRGPYLLWVCVAMIILSTLAVALRFASRKLAGYPLLLDDWTILIALPCVLMPCILDIYCTKDVGFGKHVTALAATDVKKFWFHLWISNILYSISTVLVKISILLFLHRVFRSTNFSISAAVIGGIVLLWGFATALTNTFTCAPISSYWSPTPSSTCLDRLSLTLGTSIPNILLTLTMLLLPLPHLRRLKPTQTILVASLYALAALVLALGILRLEALLQSTPSADPTWDAIPTAIFTTLESSAALLCACSLAMGPLLRFCLHGSVDPTLTTTTTMTTTRRSESVTQKTWPGRGLSLEEAEELARITGGEAPRGFWGGEGKRGMSFEGSTAGGGGGGGEDNWDGLGEKKKWRKKRKRRREYASGEIYVDAKGGVSPIGGTVLVKGKGEGGPEPPRRVKRGWSTPKESRFSDW